MHIIPFFQTLMMLVARRSLNVLAPASCMVALRLLLCRPLAVLALTASCIFDVLVHSKIRICGQVSLAVHQDSLMIKHGRIFQVVGRKNEDRSPPSINTDIRSPIFRTKYPRWMFTYHLRAFHANTNIINATRVLTKQHQLEAVYAVCQ